MPPRLTTLITDARIYTAPYLIPAGAVLAVVFLVLIWRALRKQDPETLAVKVAILLASAFSAQGTYEVATTKAHLPVSLAAGLFVVFEMLMLASGRRAHRHFLETSTETEAGTLGPHAAFVWIIASIAGFVVSLIATSAPEYFVRLSMPLLVAGIWRLGYVSPKAKRKIVDAITFKWTWRRLGEKIGLLEPGEKSLATVSADRRRRQMIAHAHSYHRGSLLLGWWHGSRLRKLALDADDELIELVQASVDRVHRIEALTAPASTGTALPGRWWLHPWRNARKTAIGVETARIELDAIRLASTTEAESTRLAHLAAIEAIRVATASEAEATRLAHAASIEALRLDMVRLTSESAEATSRLTAEAIGHLEHAEAIEAKAALDIEAARREGEAAGRLAMEGELQRLRGELLDAREAVPPQPPHTPNQRPERKKATQAVSTLATDQALATQLFSAYEAKADAGSPPSTYWVKMTGPCGSNQSERVWALLASMYFEARREGKTASPRDSSEATDSEADRGEAIAV